MPTSLEAIGADPTRFYLGPARSHRTERDGILTVERPAPSRPDVWTYDPLDTRPGSADMDNDNDVVHDANRELHGQGLAFMTPVFSRASEISGFPTAMLWLELDVPDTDFRITLEEITPAGHAILLSDTQLRARYRESLREATLVQPGAVLPYHFRQFRFMSRRVAKGSRVRLTIESPNSIGIQKNYNSGGVVAQESNKDARTAHISLYHEVDRWSVLELPITTSTPPRR